MLFDPVLQHKSGSTKTKRTKAEIGQLLVQTLAHLGRGADGHDEARAAYKGARRELFLATRHLVHRRCTAVQTKADIAGAAAAALCDHLGHEGVRGRATTAATAGARRVERRVDGREKLDHMLTFLHQALCVGLELARLHKEVLLLLNSRRKMKWDFFSFLSFRFETNLDLFRCAAEQTVQLGLALNLALLVVNILGHLGLDGGVGHVVSQLDQFPGDGVVSCFGVLTAGFCTFERFVFIFFSYLDRLAALQPVGDNGEAEVEPLTQLKQVVRILLCPLGVLKVQLVLVGSVLDHLEVLVEFRVRVVCFFYFFLSLLKLHCVESQRASTCRCILCTDPVAQLEAV